MHDVPTFIDIPFLSATALSRLVRTRQVSCVELLDIFIGRVERLDQRINAVVVRDFDVARERARRMDSLLASPSFQPGPLVGSSAGTRSLPWRGWIR